MSAMLALLLTAVAVYYVAAPILRKRAAARPVLLPDRSEVLVADGITYLSEDEWAVDRALRKATGGEPLRRARNAQLDLDSEVETRVAAVRAVRRAERAGKKRVLCQGCGKAFQTGDRFCARCGDVHPSACPQCGERHHPSDYFCTSCGAPLPGGTP